METINWSDFEKIEIRTGTIIKAENFAEARKPAFKLWIDFGDYGIKKSSAQITSYYDVASLAGKQIVAVVNFPPKQIAGFISECLVLGAVETDGKVILLETERKTGNGLRIA
ncbi:MAG TPA: tRNA-binding protein [Bacteroidia bacterium]|nr:tRNA-binding protein [Bacteroidia bacterium]